MNNAQRMETLNEVMERLSGIIERENNALAIRDYAPLDAVLDEKERLVQALVLLLAGLKKSSQPTAEPALESPALPDAPDGEDPVQPAAFEKFTERANHLLALADDNTRRLQCALTARVMFMEAVKESAKQATPRTDCYTNTGHASTDPCINGLTAMPITINQVL